jgi:hypothetical protein
LFTRYLLLFLLLLMLLFLVDLTHPAFTSLALVCVMQYTHMYIWVCFNFCFSFLLLLLRHFIVNTEYKIWSCIYLHLLGNLKSQMRQILLKAYELPLCSPFVDDLLRTRKEFNNHFPWMTWVLSNNAALLFLCNRSATEPGVSTSQFPGLETNARNI